MSIIQTSFPRTARPVACAKRTDTDAGCVPLGILLFCTPGGIS